MRDALARARRRVMLWSHASIAAGDGVESWLLALVSRGCRLRTSSVVRMMRFGRRRIIADIAVVRAFVDGWLVGREYINLR